MLVVRKRGEFQNIPQAISGNIDHNSRSFDRFPAG